MEARAAILMNILLVEDTEDDVFFFRHALESSRLNARLVHVSNSEEAIAYLKAEPPFENRSIHPFPDMVVTDIKMPRGSGFEILEWLKHHPKCKVIPTLILTSSGQNPDVQRAYELGVNAYVQKPQTIHALGELLQVTYSFWSKCLRPQPPPELKCG